LRRLPHHLHRFATRRERHAPSSLAMSQTRRVLSMARQGMGYHASVMVPAKPVAHGG
jgi:hypothetical protein